MATKLEAAMTSLMNSAVAAKDQRPSITVDKLKLPGSDLGTIITSVTRKDITTSNI